MSEEQLKECFRKQELQRRARRNRIILNHATLAEENLTPEEKEVTIKALRSIRNANEDFEKATEPRSFRKRFGYWKTLWVAFRGKI